MEEPIDRNRVGDQYFQNDRQVLPFWNKVKDDFDLTDSYRAVNPTTRRYSFSSELRRGSRALLSQRLQKRFLWSLRTTVPSVSYIRNSLRFWYYASLSTCCHNLEKKIRVTGKIWEKAGVKLLRHLTEKSVNFSTLATSNIRLLLVFGEEDQ